jgi:hypothetical protein
MSDSAVVFFRAALQKLAASTAKLSYEIICLHNHRAHDGLAWTGWHSGDFVSFSAQFEDAGTYKREHWAVEK